MTINTCNLRPKSVGSVSLHSADPAVAPAIDPNFLSDPHDWKISLEGFKWGREMLATKAYAPFVKREHMPGAEVRTDQQIREYVRQWAKTDYHPVGSCKMGEDDMAVVDQQLRVRGLEGLRVIDASIVPRLISGNTQGHIGHDWREGCTPHHPPGVLADRRAVAAPADLSAWMAVPDGHAAQPIRRCTEQRLREVAHRTFRDINEALAAPVWLRSTLAKPWPPRCGSAQPLQGKDNR
jgi:hypothetical protein